MTQLENEWVSPVVLRNTSVAIVVRLNPDKEPPPRGTVVILSTNGDAQQCSGKRAGFQIPRKRWGST